MQKEAKQQYMYDEKYKEERAKSKNDYYANIIKVQKEKEELSCKINKVLREMYKSRDTPGTKQVYENFIQHQEEKRKSLEKLMEINNKLGMNRSVKQESEEKDKEIKAREKRLEIAEANKLKARCTKEIECDQANKLSSDRQSLIVINKGRIKKKERDIGEYDENPPPHFGPCNKLMSALKKRIQQPPSWTGANTAHQEFARNADIMLRDCKYKRPGRKVVDMLAFMGATAFRPPDLKESICSCG
ncbi:unnamed protein product [Arctia plantaginis]|uniref:Uncharacterized protein n=1 Tax=Arctia plantaginis TaxID=874455 RepID=A0A8S0ZK54_ARCPL|nr:unnamed protein product [Arctia plantaginis]